KIERNCATLQRQAAGSQRRAETGSTGFHSKRGETRWGSKGIEIVGMDVQQLLSVLNKAFADEWLAYYQYWLGAKVAKGPMKEAVIAELLQHATDELRHADMVAARIIQLGGTPVTEPKKWYEVTSCGYEAPDDPFVAAILKQNIQGERCAIGFYKRLLDITQGKDPVTYNMVLQILQDEVEHEEDLEALSEDLELMLKK
ncbi:MAG TPA: ferritin-like domain-containing protein, partial [Terriglobales bacterium]|nr:ferritin-like domain-containing protein [Terriglobales bacterium]